MSPVLPNLSQRDQKVWASLIASVGAPESAATLESPVAPFEGVIGLEGMLTGDGRLIAEDSLTWAEFPLPLRWVKSDIGGHDGAVIVGRIDRVERRDNGDIYAWGVIDLGSDEGREVARLMKGQFLSGVSMDLDSVNAFEGDVIEFNEDGTEKTIPSAVITEKGRVRAATLVAIPAFDEARLSLVASMGGDKTRRVPVGHASFALDFASAEEERAAFRLGTAAAWRSALARRQALKEFGARIEAFAPKARALAEMRSLVEGRLGHQIGTFAGNLNYLKQWRNPKNGQWIDMPGAALLKLADLFGTPEMQQKASASKAANLKSLGGKVTRDLEAGDLPTAQGNVATALDEVAGAPELVDNPEAADAIEALEAFQGLSDISEMGLDSAEVDLGDLEGASFDEPEVTTDDDAAAIAQIMDDITLAGQESGNARAAQAINRWLDEGDFVSAENLARESGWTGSADDIHALYNPSESAPEGDATAGVSLYRKESAGGITDLDNDLLQRIKDWPVGTIIEGDNAGAFRFRKDDTNSWVNELNDEPFTDYEIMKAVARGENDVVLPVGESPSLAEVRARGEEITADLSGPDESWIERTDAKAAEAGLVKDEGSGGYDLPDGSRIIPASETSWDIYGPNGEDLGEATSFEDALTLARGTDGIPAEEQIKRALDKLNGFTNAGHGVWMRVNDPDLRGGSVVFEYDATDDEFWSTDGDGVSFLATPDYIKQLAERGGSMEVLGYPDGNGGYTQSPAAQRLSKDATGRLFDNATATRLDERPDGSIIARGGPRSGQTYPSVEDYLADTPEYDSVPSGSGFTPEESDKLEEAGWFEGSEGFIGPDGLSRITRQSDGSYDLDVATDEDLTDFETTNFPTLDEALAASGSAGGGEYDPNEPLTINYPSMSPGFAEDVAVNDPNLTVKELGPDPEDPEMMLYEISGTRSNLEGFIEGRNPGTELDSFLSKRSESSSDVRRPEPGKAATDFTDAELKSQIDEIMSGRTLETVPDEDWDYVVEARAELRNRKEAFEKSKGLSTPEQLSAAAQAYPDVFNEGADDARYQFGGAPDHYKIEETPTGEFILRPANKDESNLGDHGHFPTLEEARAAQAGREAGFDAWTELNAAVYDGRLDPTVAEDPQQIGPIWASVKDLVLNGGVDPKKAVDNVLKETGADAPTNQPERRVPREIASNAEIEAASDDLRRNLEDEDPADREDFVREYVRSAGGWRDLPPAEQDNIVERIMSTLGEEFFQPNDSDEPDDDEFASKAPPEFVKKTEGKDDAEEKPEGAGKGGRPFARAAKAAPKETVIGAFDEEDLAAEDCGCEELAEGGVQTFAPSGFNPAKHWRDPRDGQFIDMPGTALAKLLAVLDDGGVPVRDDARERATAYAERLDTALEGGDWDTVFRITPDFYDETSGLYEDYLEAAGTDTYASAAEAYEALENTVMAASAASDAVYIGEVGAFDEPDGDGHAFGDAASALDISPDTGAELTEDEIADVDALAPAFTSSVEEFAKKRKNWVETTGTGHLPRYIRRIADHLMARGMTESHAIAAAVNTVKRWARGGSAAKGQKGHVSPETVAKAQAALAEWEAKRAQARAASAVTVTFAGDLDQVQYRDVSTDERERLAKEGDALPDGSFPIANRSDLENAIRAVGRAKDPEKTKAFIRRRARELDAEDLLPDTWARAEVMRRIEGEELAELLHEIAEAPIIDATDEPVDNLDPTAPHPSRSSLVASIGRVKGAKGEAPKLVAPLEPPKAWFDNPGFTAATPLTVTPEGRVYGHLATWDACHMESHALGERCARAPRSRSGYALFHTGYVTTAEGVDVPTGHLIADAPHADPVWDLDSTLVHYSHSGKVAADVRAGEDKYGIWVAGALRPDVPPTMVRTLKASPLSGDWRADPRTGHLELVAGLAVNVPGFMPRPRGMVASIGTVSSMQAIGLVAPRQVVKPGTPGSLAREDLAFLKERAAATRSWSNDAERIDTARLAQETVIENFARRRMIEELAHRIKEMR